MSSSYFLLFQSNLVIKTTLIFGQNIIHQKEKSCVKLLVSESLIRLVLLILFKVRVCIYKDASCLRLFLCPSPLSTDGFTSREGLE